MDWIFFLYIYIIYWIIYDIYILNTSWISYRNCCSLSHIRRRNILNLFDLYFHYILKTYRIRDQRILCFSEKYFRIICYIYNFRIRWRNILNLCDIYFHYIFKTYRIWNLSLKRYIEFMWYIFSVHSQSVLDMRK